MILNNFQRRHMDLNDRIVATKLTLDLLANNDTEIQLAMYVECHKLIVETLGVTLSKGKHSWSKISFLLEQSILVEIICHGANHENPEV